MSINRSRGHLLASTLFAGVATAVIAGAFVGAPAVAQDFQNVTAAGRVQGTDGKPIANATIAYKNNAKGYTTTVRSDASGNFKIPQTAPGTYTVTITADGYTNYEDPSVDIEISQTSNEFTLASTTAETNGAIVVTAGRRKVADFERTTTGAVVNVADLSKRVPVPRNVTSIILLAPGTATGDTAFGNLAGISGSSVSENQFFVNGLDISDQRNGLSANEVPYEFYDTVDVKTGGYPAEFGRSTGGFISATTKSGSNTFHAGAVVTYSPNSLNSTAPDTYAAANHLDHRTSGDAYFYASGPIIKDHLFFYGFYNPRWLNTGDGSYQSGVYSTVTTHSPYKGGKVDAVITDGQRLEFTIFDVSQTQATDGVYFQDVLNPDGSVLHHKNDYAGGTTNKYGGLNYVGRYTGKFTDWFTLSAAYGVSKNTSTQTPTSPLPYVTDDRTGSTAIIGNPAESVAAYNDKRTFYRADADFYFKLLGSHHLRGGYDRENLESGEISGYTGPGGNYYDLLVGPTSRYGVPAGVQYVTARHFENNGDFKAHDQAFYIEDSWSLLRDRLTLQLGLRNDKFQNDSVSGEPFYKSGNQWGPRLGFTFDPVGNGRTKVYGSFSRYFLPIPTNTDERLAGAELDYTQVYLLNGVNADGTPIIGAPVTGFANATTCGGSTVANCRLVSDGTPTPTEATVSHSLKPQSVDEYILGGEQRIGQHIKVGLYGTYRKLNKSLEDAAVDQAILHYCTQQGISGCDDLWSGFSQYVLLNPGSGASITLNSPINGETTLRTVNFSAADLNIPKAKRTYKAVTATFDREFDGKWSLSASYTWSKLKGNIEGGVKSDNGQTDAGLTEDFDQPGLTYGAYGYLPNDRRHQIKLYGAYQLTPQFLIGANFQLASPRRFGCIGVVPADVDPFANVYGAAGHYCPLANGVLSNDNPVVLVPRGTVFKSDWLKQLDLGVTFSPIPDNKNLSFQINVTNILNTHAKLDFNEDGTNDGGTVNLDYRKVTTYETPRAVRFVARVGF